MNSRRRFARYVLPVPATGRARTVSDCVVESWDGESAVVATGQPARRDDQVALQFNAPGGATRLYQAHVMGCEMDTQHGSLRFRLHLRLTAGLDQPGARVDFPVRSPRGPRP
jgi:hypothetical protein